MRNGKDDAKVYLNYNSLHISILPKLHGIVLVIYCYHNREFLTGKENPISYPHLKKTLFDLSIQLVIQSCCQILDLVVYLSLLYPCY